jgi:hypothetical protein
MISSLVVMDNFYTDPIFYKTVFARPPGGPSIPLLPIGSVPFANQEMLGHTK